MGIEDDACTISHVRHGCDVEICRSSFLNAQKGTEPRHACRIVSLRCSNGIFHELFSVNFHCIKGISRNNKILGYPFALRHECMYDHGEIFNLLMDCGLQ